MTDATRSELMDALLEYRSAHDELTRACKAWAAEAVICVVDGIGGEARREGIAAFVERNDAEKRWIKACDRFDRARMACAREQLAETEPTP